MLGGLRLHSRHADEICSGVDDLPVSFPSKLTEGKGVAWAMGFKIWGGGSKVNGKRGLGHQGAYHVKDCIVDRRVYFTGSANFTKKSERNQATSFGTKVSKLEFVKQL